MEGYKERLIAEYTETKERYDKLRKILVKHDAGTLGFKLNCPADILSEQATIMAKYLYILEIRAEIENIAL